MEIILDISANSTKNDDAYLKRMLDELKAVDTGKHEIIIKGQLFRRAGDNIVMTRDHYRYMHNYAKELGYKCTASVFDYPSLQFLLDFALEIPFIKIANSTKHYWIIGEIPRKHRLYVSNHHGEGMSYEDASSGIEKFDCVSKYPASIVDYEGMFSPNLSDHTIGWELFKSKEKKKHNKLKRYECHYALEDSTGLDAESGVCRTPAQLKEIL